MTRHTSAQLGSNFSASCFRLPVCNERWKEQKGVKPASLKTSSLSAGWTNPVEKHGKLLIIWDHIPKEINKTPKTKNDFEKHSYIYGAQWSSHLPEPMSNWPLSVSLQIRPLECCLEGLLNEAPHRNKTGERNQDGRNVVQGFALCRFIHL